MEEGLEELFYLPRLQGFLPSPNGDYVAWCWCGPTDTYNLWVADLNDPTSTKQLTNLPENCTIQSWLPDSSGLVFGVDAGGDEKTVLYTVDIRSHAVVQRTASNPRYYLRGGEVTADLKYLVYAANVDLVTDQETEEVAIVRHDLTTGERIVLTRTEKAAAVFPVLSPDGKQILYGRRDLYPSGRQLWLIDIDGKNDREIINCGDSGKAIGSFMPSGKELCVVLEEHGQTKLALYQIDSGNIKILIDNPDRHFEYAFCARVPLADQITAIEVRDTQIICALVDPKTGDETPIESSVVTQIPVAPIANGEWIFFIYSGAKPRELVIKKINAQNYRSITAYQQRKGLSPHVFSEGESYHWQSPDGLRIQGWLYRHRTAAQIGTILLIHGGPTAHFDNDFSIQVQFYAQRGFTVLAPNYRGSTGFSLEFRELIKKDGWGGAEQLDISSAAQALIADGIATPGKIGVTGLSYGGYSSWHQIVHTAPELIAAAAPICGMTDLAVDYFTTRPDLKPYSEAMMGGSPTDLPEKYYNASPINFVDQIKGRLLIIQGLRDPNVTINNLEVVKAALNSAKVPFETLIFEDEGHGIFKTTNIRILYSTIADFFTRAFLG